MTDLNLPEPIAAYFDADKREGEGVAQCFTTQAVVRDEGQTYSGLEAIKAWKTAAATKYSYTSEPFAVEQEDRRYIVTCRLIGSFPGSPVDLRFAFRLECGKIAFLEITPAVRAPADQWATRAPAVARGEPQLKRLMADLTLDKVMLQEVLTKNVWSAPRMQGFLMSDEDSLHKCIRPLASKLRL